MTDLLHLRDSRVGRQASDGSYGVPKPFTPAALRAHLAGEQTIAINVLSSVTERALFLALDVDQDFEPLEPVIGNVIEEVGGIDLLAASFITNGSSFGRGKVIVALEYPSPHQRARAIAKDIERRVRRSDEGRVLPAGAMDAFPKDHKGGIVRILGRNPKRNGPLEEAFTLDGVPSPTLEHVRPLTQSAFEAISVETIVPLFVHRLLTKPWNANEGTKTHFGRMTRLAQEAIRLEGEAAGRVLYDRWVEEVRANSPELAYRSLKNGDPRCVLDHARENAWQLALAPRLEWIPLAASNVGPQVAGVYHALCGFVALNGLRPYAFAIDYKRLGELIGKSPQRAYALVVAAENAGLLVRLDKGSTHKLGVRGLATMYGLVGLHETPESVRAAGADDRLVRERLIRNPGRGPNGLGR